MNLRTFTLILIALPFLLPAQITIEMADIPSSGESFVAYRDTMQYPVSSSGPNQVWDYSMMQKADSNSIILVLPDSCINANDFPNASYCQRNVYGFGNNYHAITDSSWERSGFVLNQLV